MTSCLDEGGNTHELQVPEVDAWVLAPVLHNPHGNGLPGKGRSADKNKRESRLKTITTEMDKAAKRQGHVDAPARRRIYTKAAFIEYVLYATAPSLEDYEDIFNKYAYGASSWNNCYAWIMETKTKKKAEPEDAAGGAEPPAKRQRFETADERLECCVCKDAERNVALRPCWHVALCAGCAERCTTCPVCSVTIEQKHPIFLS